MIPSSGGDTTGNGNLAPVEGPSDALLICGRDLREGELYSLAGGSVAVFTARRPDSEEANEDAAALIPYDPHRGVLAVADGVGGGPAGGHAAALALEALRDALIEAARDGDELRAGVLNGFERANRILLDRGGGSCTTLVVAAIEGLSVRPYHAGDSELLVTGQRGLLKLRTVSHSPAGYAVEAGLIDAEEALHHEERHVISNAIGSDDMRIEIGPRLALAGRDSVVLGSDGLFDNLSADEIVEHARIGPPGEALRAMVGECRRRMVEPRAGEPSKPDDLTAVLFRPT